MQGKKLKYVFIVQGEGRGHLTQAITLADVLQRNGHVVEHVFVGTNSKKRIPNFFLKKIDAGKIELIQSPGFVIDKDDKGIRIWLTILKGILNLHKFFHSCVRINRVTQQSNPDFIINFYDPIGGLYNLLFQPQIPSICVGHQYLAHTKGFEFASGAVDKQLFLLNNKLTSIGAETTLALSFGSVQTSKSKGLKIVPPLLRSDLYKIETSNESYLLVYLLNEGYGADLIEWHSKNTEVKIHCFWDNTNLPDNYNPHQNITFHKLDDQKFLRYMASCAGYICTAGFESICEAMYLGKPVMMVPVKGHYEQSCNAIDAHNAGAGIWSEGFDLSSFLNYIKGFKDKQNDFREWVELSEQYFMEVCSKEKEYSKIKTGRLLGQPHLTLPQHAH